MQTYELCSDMIDVVLDMSSLYSPPLSTKTAISTTNMNNNSTINMNNSNSAASSSLGKNNMLQHEMYSVIKLSNGVLYLRSVNTHLVMVCLIREDSFDKQGLIDYNFRCIRQSLLQVLQ
jgi:Ras-related GTP-binding protein C/D